MNNFWRNFNKGFSQGMFNGMANYFMPQCCWGFGFDLGMSVWNSPPMMGFGMFMQPSIFTPPPMSMPFMAMSAPMMSMPMMSNFDMNYSMPLNWSAGFSQSWNNPFSQSSFSTQNTSQNDVSITYNAEELYNKWSEKGISDKAELTKEFCQKVIDIGKRTNCNADDIMAIMFHESRFNPKAKNELGYVGLIQFGASTLGGLRVPGNTADEQRNTILNMSSMDQLDYVEEYINTWRERLKYSSNQRITLGDLAAIILYPKNAKQNVVIDKNKSDELNAYNKNKPLDLNKDGKITKDELVRHIKQSK